MHRDGSSIVAISCLVEKGRAKYWLNILARRCNPIIKAYYERLRAVGKPMKVGSTACARKLLHIAYAVVTHERAFDPNYQSATIGEAARA